MIVVYACLYAYYKVILYLLADMAGLELAA
jgi:hypothetical protein